jgi:hypothetical protein
LELIQKLSLQHALQKLVKGNEIDLAAILARVLKIQPADHVYNYLALRCENLGLRYGLLIKQPFLLIYICRDMAMDVMRMMRNSSVQLSLMCARFQGTPAQIAELYQKV